MEVDALEVMGIDPVGYWWGHVGGLWRCDVTRMVKLAAYLLPHLQRRIMWLERLTRASDYGWRCLGRFIRHSLA